jgi:hypothetical protein
MNMTEVIKAAEAAYSIMENIIADGDLSKLSAKQRVEYYHKTCESLGLNPITRPFEYQKFNGKIVLYARKEATEQLRFIHKVSIYEMKKEVINDCYVVTSYAETADGKKDIGTGAVSIVGLKGEALSNAMMKAETKSKRRVTLSICGLGFTDESEISSIPNSQAVNINHETGELLPDAPPIQCPVPLKLDVQPEQIAPPREELVNAVATARTINDLKNHYGRAYKVHAGNLELMKDITKLKDIRVKQLEEFERQKTEVTYDDPFPILPERAIIAEDFLL